MNKFPELYLNVTRWQISLSRLFDSYELLLKDKFLFLCMSYPLHKTSCCSNLSKMMKKRVTGRNFSLGDPTTSEVLKRYYQHLLMDGHRDLIDSTLFKLLKRTQNDHILTNIFLILYFNQRKCFWFFINLQMFKDFLHFFKMIN